MDFEKYFIDTHRYLNEIGLDHWLIGSSLLGPLREGHLIDGDREANFGVMADDLVKFKPKFFEKYRVVIAKNLTRVSGIYLLDKRCKTDDLWEQPYPFTWLAPHYLTCGKVVQCVGRSHILFWDEGELLPMDHMQYGGEVFTVPRQSHKWLETYYGPDYMTRDPNWHWQNNSHNHINLEELGIC